MFLNCCHFDVLWLSCRKTPQNSVDSIGVVSSKSNLPDSTAMMESLVDIAIALHTHELVRGGVPRRCKDLHGDKCSTDIT